MTAEDSLRFYLLPNARIEANIERRRRVRIEYARRIENNGDSAPQHSPTTSTKKKKNKTSKKELSKRVIELEIEQRDSKIAHLEAKVKHGDLIKKNIISLGGNPIHSVATAMVNIPESTIGDNLENMATVGNVDNLRALALAAVARDMESDADRTE